MIRLERNQLTLSVWERTENLGWVWEGGAPATKTSKWGFSIGLRGLLFWKTVDEPNEAMLLALFVWGLGFEPYVGGWVFPWKIYRVVI